LCLQLNTSLENIELQIKYGDKLAFEKVFKEHYQHLCNFAFQFLKEKAASEEIVQDVFFKLWEKRESTEIKTIKSYLFSTVRNSCLNQIKHLEIRDTYKQHNEAQIQYSEQQNYDSVVENELSNHIEKAISSLPVERQKVFKLSRFEGKKYKEIAEELGVSVKTVESQMSKALKFLREELSEYLPVIIMLIMVWIKNILK